MHVKIRNSTKSQSCWPKHVEWRTFEKPEIKRLSPAKLHCHTFVSYFQMSACLFRVLRPMALKLGHLTNFNVLFLTMESIFFGW